MGEPNRYAEWTNAELLEEIGFLRDLMREQAFSRDALGYNENAAEVRRLRQEVCRRTRTSAGPSQPGERS